MATEKRLIAEALKKYHDSKFTPGVYEHSIFGKAAMLLETDAEEVVRCEDCKSCKTCYPEKQIGKEATPGWFCKEHGRYRRPDDFCSYGERRTDNA